MGVYQEQKRSLRAKTTKGKGHEECNREIQAVRVETGVWDGIGRDEQGGAPVATPFVTKTRQLP
jgi:hypothetical protein